MPKGKYIRTVEMRKSASQIRLGKSSGMLGKHHSEETKKKQSFAHLGQKETAEHKKKQSLANLGNKFAVTHGLTKHRLFVAYQDMLLRCYNPKATNYKNYGGRGIIVCERWRDSINAQGLRNFIEDMNPTFVEGLTLDRRENNGNYEPSNCKWSTWKEQRNNQRRCGKKSQI
jgi:hypothetical protein